MGGIELVRAEDPARAGDVDGHVTLKHRAHLHRRRVRAHDLLGVFTADVERVLQRAGGVVRDEVQRVEVEVLRLYLWALGNLPPHADENVGNVFGQRGDRVHRTRLRAGSRQRNVHLLLAQLALAVLLFALHSELGVRLLGAAAGHVDQPAGIFALIFGQGAKRAARLRDRGLVPEVQAVRVFERREVRRRFERGDCFVRCPVEGVLGQFNFGSWVRVIGHACVHPHLSTRALRPKSRTQRGRFKSVH